MALSSRCAFDILMLTDFRKPKVADYIPELRIPHRSKNAVLLRRNPLTEVLVYSIPKKKQDISAAELLLWQLVVPYSTDSSRTRYGMLISSQQR